MFSNKTDLPIHRTYVHASPDPYKSGEITLHVRGEDRGQTILHITAAEAEELEAELAQARAEATRSHAA